MTASEGKKNLCLIGVPEGADRDRGLESVFEQIIAENVPNVGREIGIQIQEIDLPPKKSVKTIQHPEFNSETSRFQR